jgi:hypothetical protein
MAKALKSPRKGKETASLRAFLSREVQSLQVIAGSCLSVEILVKKSRGFFLAMFKIK